jgi:hypothetical protein
VRRINAIGHVILKSGVAATKDIQSDSLKRAGNAIVKGNAKGIGKMDIKGLVFIPLKVFLRT